MPDVSNVVTLEQLAHDFTSLFRHRVFRLEVMDYYDAENEREPYARFLAGEQVDDAWREPWKKLVRGVRESGRIMQRVQVVSEPPSDYQRFALLHGKPASVEAGEDVRIVGRRAADGELPLGDFWLFDDDAAAVLAYDDGGSIERVLMMRREVASERFMLTFLREVRDKALGLAVPLGRYVTEQNITSERKHAA